MKKFWGFLLLIGGLLLALLASTYITWQQHAIHDFIPVPAKILDASVAVHHGSKGSISYSPEITYSYDFNDHPYTSNQVLTFSANGDQSWADDILSRYGGPTYQLTGIEAVPFRATAYIDRDNPSDSILVRDYSAQPYIFTTICLLVAAFGAGLLTQVIGTARTTMAALALDDSGWQLLLPTLNLRKSYRHAVGIFITMALVLLPPLFHWLLIANQRSFLTWLVTGILSIILLLFLILVIRRWNISRHISDPRLRVRPAPLRRGEPFSIELEADAFTPLRVTQARCRVVCTEYYKERRGSKTQVGNRKKGEQTAILSEKTEIPAGQLLTGKGELLFDSAAWPPSTDTGPKNYPYYTWAATVEIDLEGMVDYRGQFPLKVE